MLWWCPACYNLVVPTLGGCGQTQQLGSTGHHTALPAVRAGGKDLEA